MKDNIKRIFEENIRLIGNMDKAVYYFREQQYNKALQIVVDSIDQMNYIIEAVILDEEYFKLPGKEAVLHMLSDILKAKKNNDFILLADLLELQLTSFLCSVQEIIISKEEIPYNEENYLKNINLLMSRGMNFENWLKEPMDTDKLLEYGYRVEFTTCGLMTLAAENEGFNFYFHTNSHIQLEAFLLANHWLKEDRKKYIIFGFGMGYHIRELIELDPEADFEIYESDQNVIQLACAFTDLSDIFAKEHIHIIYDPELNQIENRISALNQEVVCIHYPSYKNIKSNKRGLLESFIPWSKMIETC